jgi:ketosteroid isomerase-like protein
MRYLIALCLTLAPVCLVAQNRDDTSVREIEQAERAYNDARLANDIASLNRMTAPDYFAVSARGTTREVGNQRTEPVNMTPSGVMEKSELRNMRVKVYGDSAVSTYEQRVEARQTDGRSVEVKVVSTKVWVKRDGQWLIASCTPPFNRTTE